LSSEVRRALAEPRERRLARRDAPVELQSIRLGEELSPSRAARDPGALEVRGKDERRRPEPRLAELLLLAARRLDRSGVPTLGGRKPPGERGALRERRRAHPAHARGTRSRERRLRAGRDRADLL